MPTDVELSELKEKCTWTWTTQNGVKGYKVTSKTNGNSIFLPAAGYRDESDSYNDDSGLYYAGSYGNYWSSSLSTSSSNHAYALRFGSANLDRRSYYRYYGCNVRPVMP